MITSDHLIALHKRIRGSELVLSFGSDPTPIGIKWGIAPIEINLFHPNFAAQACFALLDRIEARGDSTLLRSMSDGFVAETGYPGSMLQAAGDTRIEAVVRLFILVMPEVQ